MGTDPRSSRPPQLVQGSRKRTFRFQGRVCPLASLSRERSGAPRNRTVCRFMEVSQHFHGRNMCRDGNWVLDYKFRWFGAESSKDFSARFDVHQNARSRHVRIADVDIFWKSRSLAHPNWLYCL